MAVAKAGMNMIGKHNAQGGRSYATPVQNDVMKEYAFEVGHHHYISFTLRIPFDDI